MTSPERSWRTRRLRRSASTPSGKPNMANVADGGRGRAERIDAHDQGQGGDDPRHRHARHGGGHDGPAARQDRPRHRPQRPIRRASTIPIWLFTVEVSLAGLKPFPAMFGHRVPLAKAGSDRARRPAFGRGRRVEPIPGGRDRLGSVAHRRHVLTERPRPATAGATATARASRTRPSRSATPPRLAWRS
jgi:hypothetical protein